MSMYVRLKRKKMTIFLTVEPTDTIKELKAKLAEPLSKEPEQLRIHKDKTVLEDSKKLAELEIENDEILPLTYQQEDGSWEEVDITMPEGESAGGREFYG